MTPDSGQYPPGACGTSSPARPASSGRISPRRSSRGRPRRHRDRLLHRLLRPGAEGGERPRARASRLTLDLAEDELDFAGLDGVFHLAGQPGVRSFGDVFPTLPAPERPRLAARVRGGGARRRPGRLRLVLVGLRRGRALPDARGHAAAAALALRDHEARLRAARRRLRARVRARLRRAALLQRVRAEAAPRHGVHADRQRARRRRDVRRSTATATSRAAGRMSADIVDATVAAMERGTGTYNVGGALEASLNETIALLEQISGRTLDVVREPAVPGDQRRTSADTTRIRAGARLGARGHARGRVCARSGSGPRLECRSHERRPGSQRISAASARSTSGAGGRASAPAGGSPPSGSSIGIVVGAALLAERRQRLRRLGADRARPGVQSRRHDAGAELPHEPGRDPVLATRAGDPREGRGEDRA